MRLLELLTKRQLLRAQVGRILAGAQKALLPLACLRLERCAARLLLLEHALELFVALCAVGNLSCGRGELLS